MTAHHQCGCFLPIEDLLARIRACIADTDAIVYLTINVEKSGETTAFRLHVQPDGSLVASSASSSPPSESKQLPLATFTSPPPLAGPHDTSQSSVLTEMNHAEGHAMLAQKSRMEQDEDHERWTPEDSAPVCEDDSSAREARSASSCADTDRCINATSPSIKPSTQSNSIRRSARQQHAPDRLAYPFTASSLGVTGPGTKCMAVTHKAPAVHAFIESTDTEASDSSWMPCSSSHVRPVQCYQHKHHKKRRVDVPGYSDDSGEEEQVADLVLKLKEASSRRQQELDMENMSKQAVLQLGREILGAGNVNAADVDVVNYQQCTLKINLLISMSTAMRMVGYYLRSVLAARLKRSHRTKYVRSARLLLGLKSSADISAYPAFYEYVQEHCLSVAHAKTDIEAWLQEPIFLADIGWLEWRRYLGKPHRWILDAAMEQFTASLLPSQDWMQRGWVEEYDDVHFGRGVRAVRDILLPTPRVRDSAAVAADLELVPQASTGQDSIPWYRFEWNGGKQQFDAEHHWVGKINHQPMPHCNLRLTGNGKLMQRRQIAAGEALTFDYGVEWWAYRVTGVPWKEWMTTGSTARRKGSAELFVRMHESVLDYTPLLSKAWDKRLREATSEVEREQVLLELWEDVAPTEEQEREMQM